MRRFALLLCSALLCSDRPLLLSTVPSSEPWTRLSVRSGGRCEHLLPGKKKKKKPRRHLVFLVLQQFSVWTAALWSRKIIHLPKWDVCLFHLWKKKKEKKNIASPLNISPHCIFQRRALITRNKLELIFNGRPWLQISPGRAETSRRTRLSEDILMQTSLESSDRVSTAAFLSFHSTEKKVWEHIYRRSCQVWVTHTAQISK